MKMEINVGSSGGGSKGKLNVFAQLIEPKTKDGIWIKTERTVTVGGYTKLADIPYNFQNGSVVAVGTDIFLFGTISTSGNADYAYKYDTLTNTYTKLRNVPYKFYNGSAVAIGTDVFLFGTKELDYYRYAYKYDTLTNTYTKLADTPYNFYNGDVVAIETNIFLFGSEDTNCKQCAYKYATVIEYEEISKYDYNKLELVPNMPTTLENGNIYVFYGNKYVTKLLEQLILNFANVFLYKDNETQMYPVYCGNGEEWIKILN